ncbi:hypothetical protein [Chitinimonas sp.]|uniref:hypothetical protein n=1 Tax=Chitinimonas sp. TaxID=1934313 RepID=UPI0035B1CF80
MKFLRWLIPLFGIMTTSTAAAAQPAPTKDEHAVVVHFIYGSKDLKSLFALEDKLEKAILAAGAGEFDGNEVATDGSDGYLYMYGPNADRLFAAIKPILEKTPFMHGAKAKLRYGPPQAASQEKIVVINP